MAEAQEEAIQELPKDPVIIKTFKVIAGNPQLPAR
jgi:hypothetical protein